MIFFHFADQPLPKRQRLGVRVIDAKNAHSLFAPKINDTFQFLPKLTPLIRGEIQRIDILIFFRRIFGVLDRYHPDASETTPDVP